MIILFFSLWLAFAQISLNTLHRVEVSSLGQSKLEGKIPIDSSNYQAVCDCGTKEVQPTISCHPTKVKLSEDRSGNGVNYREISSLLGSYNFTYIKGENQAFRCLDGRDSILGISTPGGDAGEFVLALLVYEDISGIILDGETVRIYLEEWLKAMQAPRFYMCTDDDSVLHMGKQIGAQLDIISPRQDFLKDLLKIVALPRNVGDSHFKLMLEYPQLYSIRAEVVRHFITAFYSLLWDTTSHLHKLLEIDVLSGEHHEMGYVEIRNSDECIYEGISPLFPKSISMYLNYIDAVSVRRRQLAEFFAVKIARNRDGITTDKLYKRINHHGLLFLDTTGSYIAKHLPFYTALFL